MREARAVMADLAAAGLSADQLALVMELAAACTADARPVADVSAERRRAKDRERKRIVQLNPRNSAETAELSTQNTPPAFPLDVPPNEISNPPLNPPITPPKKILAIGDFDAFWRAYPRKSGKLAAAKAYASAIKRGVDPQIMLAAASAYAASPGRDPNFTKHAATWLNAGCYDDQIEEQTNGRPHTPADLQRGKPTRRQVTDNPMVLAFARMAGHIDADGNQTAPAPRRDATGAPADPREYPRPALVALSGV